MVTLKGSPKGIMITIDDENIDIARDELAKKLNECADFFNEETLEVFLTSNTLTEAEVFSLRTLVEISLLKTKVVFIENPPKLLPKQHSDLEDLMQDEGVTKFVRKTVCAGEVLEYERNIIIIGDVEKGADIIAGGNVFVMGTLAGSVCIKDPSCVVVAMKMMPEYIDIADIRAVVKSSPFKKVFAAPEIAYLSKGKIKIEQYT